MSCTGSLTTAPTRFGARLSAVISPLPKCAADAHALTPTEMASAVEREPVGDLSFVFPFMVLPSRNSRNKVTTLNNSLHNDPGFLFQRSGRRKHNNVESAFECGREIVYTLIPIVSCRNDVEATLGLDR